LPNFEIVLDYRTNNPPDELFGPDYNSMPAAQRIVALDGDIARRKFDLDRTAIERCDVCILVEPAGKSAHLEAGFAAGLSKRVIVLLDEAPAPVELMLAFASKFDTNISGLLRLLTAGT
jgi:nucleoside 2-deoxyribosyltransferase